MNSFPEYFTERRWQRAGVLLSNCVIIFLWLWLFRPVYAYLGTIFTRQEFRTNQIVLLAVLVLIGLEIRRGRSHRGDYAEKGDNIGSSLPIFTDPVHLYLPGLVLALGGALAYLAAERWLDINTLSASLFGLATYGLLACWTDKAIGAGVYRLPCCSLECSPSANIWTHLSVTPSAWRRRGWSVKVWLP